MLLANDLAQARLAGDALEATALENQFALQKGITPELQKVSPALANQLSHQILIEQSLKRQKDQQDELRRAGEQFGSTIADTFMNAAKQGVSFGDVLRQAVAKLVEMAAQLYTIKPLIASMGDTVAGTPGASTSA